MRTGELQASQLVGKVLAGRYEVVKCLGAGGMGAVYQARQISMDRMVALKLIHQQMAENEQVVARFYREMQSSSKIEHPNTIQVYDFGQTEEGQLFLAMEFLRGQSLGGLIGKTGALPLQRLVHIAAQIARALGAAHQEKLVHRDLKPDNVMLVERYGEHDFVKVLDFGIARSLDESRTQLTQDGSVIGTPTYMSPEQARGMQVDGRSDLYSLGVMLYQMAVGEVPFKADTPLSVLGMHALEDPRPPSEIAPGRVDPGLESLILRLMAKKAAERPQTAAEVEAELLAIGAAAGPDSADPNGGASDAGAQGPAKTRGPGGTSVTLVRGEKGRTGETAARRTGELAANRTGEKTLSNQAHRPGERTLADPAGRTADTLLQANGGEKTVHLANADQPQGGKKSMLIIGGVAAAVVIAGVAFVATRGTKTVEPTVAPAPRQSAEELRTSLDQAFENAGDPVAPDECRAKVRDPKTLALLGSNAKALNPDKHSPEGDKRAAAALAAGEESAGSSAEYWALRSRALLFADAPPAEALAAAQKAGSLCPGFALADNLAGNAAQKGKQLEVAQAAYLKSLQAAPDYLAPRQNLAVLALRRNKPEEAIEYLGYLIERKPQTPDAHKLRAMAQQMIGRLPEAIADFNEAVRRTPGDAGLWLQLGKAQARARETEAAQRAFCKAKALGNPEGTKLCKES